jgi:hypothetical protein
MKLLSNEFIGYHRILGLKWIIVTEKVQLVRNLSNPIRSVDFIGSFQASLTYPRGHQVSRNIMYLVSFQVDVAGLRCTHRVGANRNNSPDTVFCLGVDNYLGDDIDSLAI